MIDSWKFVEGSAVGDPKFTTRNIVINVVVVGIVVVGIVVIGSFVALRHDAVVGRHAVRDGELVICEKVFDNTDRQSYKKFGPKILEGALF